VKPDRFDMRIAFEDPLWRPARYLGCEDEAHRERLAKHVRDRREPARLPLSVATINEPEFRPGYLSELRKKIAAKPMPETVEFRPRLDRAVGDKRS
jgi:hypothetical protein